MKLWEVFKALEENPKKVFKDKHSRTIHINDKGGIQFNGVNIVRSKTFGVCYIDPKVDWQEVKQPVTWQEAFEAWLNGTPVYCILENGKRVEYDQNINFIHAHSLKTGTWYIEH